MTPTTEQQTIIDFALSSQENLLIEALAGAAKTTTAEMICRHIVDRPILFLAFTKRIADEAAKRLPAHVEVRTLNALGHRTWASYTSRRLVLKTDKSRECLRDLIKALPPREQGPHWDQMAETLQWISRAKRDGMVTDWTAPHSPVMLWDEWVERYDDEPSKEQILLIRQVLYQSIVDAYNGIIDFDDQLLMPTCFGGNWPKFPLVIVDELQDLNPLQHKMLSKLVSQRLIAVGDPWQSIYAFRGAVSNGMAAAKSNWNMHALPLSVTFRVPKAGVLRAHSRVPHMQWAEWNAEGHVEVLHEWNASSIAPEAMIVCRNNAPLLRLGFSLIRNNRAIKLVGFDIGAGLVKILKKLGPAEAINMNTLIDQWETIEMRRSKRPATVADRADCLRALCENRPNLSAAISHAENLFKQEGPLQLMSIHKCKGLEADIVYHLDPWRIAQRTKPGTEEWEQEMNCKYVAESRFKKELYLVNLEDFT